MPAKVIQHLEDEIQRLRQEQSNAMSLANLVGMTPAEVEETDERRKRIYELYEELLTLRHQTYRRSHRHNRF